MPSSPKIKKEDMLQAALELVSKNGYAALNIKAVAGELGCSTAPISWQFGGMDGLREELIPFAEQYVEDKYYSRNENELATFEQRGKGTIDLALENPNLFRFLYMGERRQLLVQALSYRRIIRMPLMCIRRWQSCLGLHQNR